MGTNLMIQKKRDEWHWAKWMQPTESHIKFKWVELAAGERLFQQGDSANSVFIIIEGQLLMERVQDNSTERSYRDSGNLVGEKDVVANRSRSATAVANIPTRLIRISKAEYTRLKKGRAWFD